MLRNSDIKAAIIITNEDGAVVVGPGNTCLLVPSPRVGFARALNYLIAEPDFDPVHLVFHHTHNRTGHIYSPVCHNNGTCKHWIGTAADAGAAVHPAVTVENCYIGSNAVLSYSVLGDHVQVGAGSIVGEAGFGFETTDDGMVKIPHIGLVMIDDFVSIGSAWPIDRGSLVIQELACDDG